MKKGHLSVSEFSKHLKKYFKHVAEVELSVSQSQTGVLLSPLKIIEKTVIYFSFYSTKDSAIKLLF